MNDKKNMFDGLSQEQIISLMDHILAIADAEKSRIKADFEKNMAKLARKRDAQKELEAVLRRAMGDG